MAGIPQRIPAIILSFSCYSIQSTLMTRTNLIHRVRITLAQLKPIHWLIIVLLVAVGITSAIILGQRNETAQAETPTEPAASATVLDAHVAWGQGLFQLTNRNTFDWQQCKFEVNATDFGDGYSVRVGTMTANGTVRILAEDFKNTAGTSYSFATQEPTRFTIRCLEANGKPGIYVGRTR